jgi:hypothetical protein
MQKSRRRTLRRELRAQFPGSIETHSLIQDFFFDADLKLRRHDYSVNIAGGFPAAQLTSDYVVADGIHFPPKRRASTNRLSITPISPGCSRSRRRNGEGQNHSVRDLRVRQEALRKRSQF